MNKKSNVRKKKEGWNWQRSWSRLHCCVENEPEHIQLLRETFRADAKSWPRDALHAARGQPNQELTFPNSLNRINFICCTDTRQWRLNMTLKTITSCHKSTCRRLFASLCFIFWGDAERWRIRSEAAIVQGLGELNGWKTACSFHGLIRISSGLRGTFRGLMVGSSSVREPLAASKPLIHSKLLQQRAKWPKVGVKPQSWWLFPSLLSSG